MNRLKSPLRRALAVAAGTLIGVTGAVAFAAPASAHHSTVEPKAVCDNVTGEWVVTWTVKSYAPADAPHYRLVRADLTPAGSTVTNIAVTPEGSYPHATHEALVGEQRLPGDATEASLTVQAQWSNGYTETGAPSNGIRFTEKCGKDSPEPTATMASTCEGTVVVTLSNGDNAKADAVITVTGEGKKGFKETKTLKPGEKDVEVEVPAESAEKVVVTEKGTDEPIAEGGWTEPEDCVPPGGAEKYYESTCKDLILTIDNTKGTETVVATFTPNKGEAQTLTVLKGEKKSASFEAFKGLVVTPSIEGDDEEYEPVKWQKPAGDECDEGGEGGGGTLPVTGAAAGGIAAGAVALLIIGAVLFFVARRRRVTFTA